MMDTERSTLDGIAAGVEEFVRLEGAVASDDTDFDRNVDLLAAGYLDSLGIIHLLTFIEREFGLALPDEVLADDRIATVNGIASILDERSRGAQAAIHSTR